MIRKSLVLLTVFAFIFGVVGVAMATNRVEVKVTSEPIPQGAECSKAGSFSFAWDEGSTIAAGDRITADLPLGAVLCNSIDIVIAPFDDVDLDTAYLTNRNFSVGTGWSPANVPITGAAAQAAVVQTVAATLNWDGTNGVFFHIWGIKNTGRITIDVIGGNGVGDGNNAWIRVTDAIGGEDDTFVLRFFDGTTNAIANASPDPDPESPEPYLVDSIWEVDTIAGTVSNYDDSADLDDNTLCVDASDFEGNTINASLDSTNDKFTFIPSNPQIAHIAPPDQIELVECKGAEASNIPLPGEQGTCELIDYETGAGYCVDDDLGRRVVVNKSSAFDDDNYFVRLEINSPSNVWWSNGNVGYQTQTTGSCTTGAALAFPRPYTYFSSTGAELDEFVGGGASCTIANRDRAKVIETSTSNIFNPSPAHRGLWIDLPSLVYDSGVQAGDEIRVTVTLLKFPCGEIFSEEIVLGVFGCQEAVAGQTLIYPYFTPLAPEEGWWDGIVVTNLSANEGTATFHLYEQDGDHATLETTIAGNFTYVELLSNILDPMELVDSPDGELGNSPAYVIVCTDFAADGFAMISNNSPSDVDGSESMGYLPRYDRPMGVCNQ